MGSLHSPHLLLYMPENGLLDLVDRRLPFGGAGDSLDKTLRYHNAKSVRMQLDHFGEKGCVPVAVCSTYQLLEHAFVERAFGFPTVLVFLGRKDAGCGLARTRKGGAWYTPGCSTPNNPNASQTPADNSRASWLYCTSKVFNTNGLGRNAVTYRSWAHRVTRRPSFKQCPGSRFSALQSMKSSVRALAVYE